MLHTTMSNDYPSDWDSRRKRVYQRDEYQCQNCKRGGESNSNIELHAHHIVPKSRGGTHQVTNLVSLYKQCHSAVHNGRDAPTVINVNKTYKDIDVFDQALSDAKKVIDLIDSTSIQDPGVLGNEVVEAHRKSAIQNLARFSLRYQAPDSTREKIIGQFVRAIVALMKLPEDVWDRYQSEDLSIEKAEQYITDLFDERHDEFNSAYDDMVSLW